MKDAWLDKHTKGWSKLAGWISSMLKQCESSVEVLKAIYWRMLVAQLSNGRHVVSRSPSPSAVWTSAFFLNCKQLSTARAEVFRQSQTRDSNIQGLSLVRLYYSSIAVIVCWSAADVTSTCLVFRMWRPRQVITSISGLWKLKLSLCSIQFIHIRNILAHLSSCAVLVSRLA